MHMTELIGRFFEDNLFGDMFFLDLAAEGFGKGGVVWRDQDTDGKFVFHNRLRVGQRG
jgi:hypothetical protein